MPLFDYRCRGCGCVTEVFIKGIGDQPGVPCGRCASTDTVRLVSRFTFRASRADKYSEEWREKAMPFLKSRPGAAELLAEGGESEEAKAYALTEKIGERVDSALENRVFKNL
jgi:putative FmdB family regulatory protein